MAPTLKAAEDAVRLPAVAMPSPRALKRMRSLKRATPKPSLRARRSLAPPALSLDPDMLASALRQYQAAAADGGSQPPRSAEPAADWRLAVQSLQRDDAAAAAAVRKRELRRRASVAACARLDAHQHVIDCNDEDDAGGGDDAESRLDEKVTGALWFSPLNSFLAEYATRCELQRTGSGGFRPLGVTILAILRDMRIVRPTFITALIYVYKFNERAAAERDAVCGHCLFLAAVLVASKYLNDRTLGNKHWARMTKVPLPSLNALEAWFLDKIGFDLFVDKQKFSAWMILYSTERQKYWEAARDARPSWATPVRAPSSPVPLYSPAAAAGEYTPPMSPCLVAAAATRPGGGVVPSRTHLDAVRRQANLRATAAAPAAIAAAAAAAAAAVAAANAAAAAQPMPSIMATPSPSAASTTSLSPLSSDLSAAPGPTVLADCPPAGLWQPPRSVNVRASISMPTLNGCTAYQQLGISEAARVQRALGPAVPSWPAPPLSAGGQLAFTLDAALCLADSDTRV